MKHSGIIIRLMITEKGTRLACENKYMLEVAPKANKIEIKKAIEEIFKVKVEKVTTMNMKGKPKRMGVHAGFRPNWKKAIVKLTEESKTIELFES